MRLSSYFNFLGESIFNVLNKRKDTSVLDKKANILLKNNNEDIYSPEFITHLINKYMKDLEYSFVIQHYAHHCLSIDKYHGRYINKMHFFKAIENSYQEGVLPQRIYSKTKKFRDSLSYENFLNNHQNDNFIFYRNNQEPIEISIQFIIDMLILPFEKLEVVMNNKPFGLSKAETAYVILSYFKLPGGFRYQNLTQKKMMLEHYLFPEQIINNIKKIEESIDIAIIDYPIQEIPYYADDIEVNPELWNSIINKLPKEFTTLEQVYFIYYQLCKNLTYYDKYFTVGETKKHSHIGFNYKLKNLSSISSSNNEVVCFEIMAIFQKFLQHLNIKYDVNDGKNRGTDIQYGSHSEVNFSIDDTFLIEADATRSVISGDMPLAKENRHLNGFLCKNTTDSVHQKFNESITKVENYIRETEFQESSFFDVVNAYKNTTDETFELSTTEKISIIINSITQTNLSQTDSLVYVTELTRMLFPDGSCNNFFILDHDKDFLPDDIHVTGVPSLKFIFSYHDDTTPDNEVKYFEYSKKTGLTHKTHEQLQEAFNSERYEYLLRHKKEIPNIEYQETEDDIYAY